MEEMNATSSESGEKLHSSKGMPCQAHRRAVVTSDAMRTTRLPARPSKRLQMTGKVGINRDGIDFESGASQ